MTSTTISDVGINLAALESHLSPGVVSEKRMTLPFPPSFNHYWRRVGNKTLISVRGRKYRKEVVSLLRLDARFLQGDVEFSAVYYPPDRRKRDLDNLLKALLDSLQHAGVYSDDSQVKSIAIRFGEVRTGGSVDVVVKTLERKK